MKGTYPEPITKLGSFKNAKVDDASWRSHPKWKKVQEVDKNVQDVITDLDLKLNKVLAKQEKEYLEGYNKYVKKKEAELGKMIVELINERNNNNNKKDKQIKELKLTNYSIKQDQLKQEERIEVFRKEVAVVPL